ncbi:phage tail assembly chaperone [Solimicrobium silvestre]|uniref:Phage tail assembly chaperone n=1 Tax=Solimicrobium silvestre TaxID=2099400 RepID=A0A2S9GZF6_9BURK|nr:phage tail assembly chaperone [Solimicrobium silvestre]PRC93088.1 hypothetical protein S2091_2174 [Solimicrobium silvestre]
MAKLTLQPKPEFKGTVEIPSAGDGLVTIEVTFIHRTKTQLDEFIKTRTGVDDHVSFMDMVSGWDLKDKFNEDNVKLLLENYISAAQVTFQRYVALLVDGKAKN